MRGVKTIAKAKRRTLRPELSIIIPVYNAEKYLKNTIDSVLAQTFRDFELILVDDGSTDRSGKICDEYEKKDRRIKVLHKKNEGSSAARNCGIEMSTGRYLGFVDCDDEIDPDMYEMLISLALSERADMALCSMRNVYEGKNKVQRSKDERYLTKVMDAKEAVLCVMEGEMNSVSPVNKLYKRRLFSGTRYPVGKDLGEDASVIVELLMKCKRVVLTDAPGYTYIHRKDSITTRKFSRRDLSIIEAYIKNYYLIKNNFPDIVDVAVMRLCWAHFFVLDKLLVSDNREEHKDIESRMIIFLRKNMRYILSDSRLTKERKAAALVLLVSVEAYRKLLMFKTERDAQR